MNKVRTFILILIALILVVFSVENRGTAPISFWPLLEDTYEIPAFILFFLGILVGIGLSAIVMAFKGVKHFTTLRSERKAKEKLSSEVETLEKELDKKPPKVEQKDYSEEGPGAPKKLTQKEE